MEELQLTELGLEYIDIDPSQINVPWDGRNAWAIFHSVERTLEALSYTYPHQVDSYRRYCSDALPAARLVLEAAARGSRRVELARTVTRCRGRGATTLLRWSRMSAASVLRRYFDDDNMIAPALATGPIVWGVSPEFPGTGLGALTYAMRHVAQVGRPVGGSGQLAEVLAQRLRASGGSILTDTPVSGIIVEGEYARGVRLQDGQELRSSIVVSAVDPRRTLVHWIKNPPHGAGPTIDRWKKEPLQEGYESKIDALVQRLPAYRQLELLRSRDSSFDPNGVSTMITPAVSDLHKAYLDMQRGVVASKPVMFANVPSYHDPSMRGNDVDAAHVFSLETLFTPYSHPGGWPSSPEPERWLALHDSLLHEGLRPDMGPWRAMTPDRYESEFHLPKGHATSFAGGPLAALRGRPKELTRYATPINGLYLCGAATFPGAGIWGASGRHCAREILGRL